MQWASKLFGMGLLDPELEKRLSDAQRRQMGQASLMDAGIAMLANSGYSRMPVSTGQALAAGLGAGRQAFAGQAQGLQEQMAAQQKAQAEQQQRAQILQGLDPELRQFAQGLALPQLMDVAKQAAGERSKAMNRAPSMSNYAKVARDAGYVPGTPEFRAYVDRLATQNKAPVTNVNLPGQISPFDRESAKLDAQALNEWRSKAVSAGGIIDTVNTLKQINSLEQGGMLGEAAAVIGKAFGTDAAANRDVFNAAAGKLVLAQAEQLAGVLSDSDIALLKSMGGRFGNDPRANAIILDILEKGAQKAINQFQSASQYRQKHGNLTGYMPDFTLPNTAATVEDRAPAFGGGGGSQPAATPMTEADYNALPSGAIYIDPEDGKRYRKP